MPTPLTTLDLTYDLTTRRLTPSNGRNVTINTGDNRVDAIAVSIEDPPENAEVCARLRTNDSKYSQTSVVKRVPMTYDNASGKWVAVLTDEVMRELRWPSVDIQLCVTIGRARELSFNKVRMTLTKAFVL